MNKRQIVVITIVVAAVVTAELSDRKLRRDIKRATEKINAKNDFIVFQGKTYPL